MISLMISLGVRDTLSEVIARGIRNLREKCMFLLVGDRAVPLRVHVAFHYKLRKMI